MPFTVKNTMGRADSGSDSIQMCDSLRVHFGHDSLRVWYTSDAIHFGRDSLRTQLASDAEHLGHISNVVHFAGCANSPRHRPHHRSSVGAEERLAELDFEFSSF